VLLKKAWTADNIREYNKNYERVKPKFILGYLTHHLKINKWTMAFWEGDKIGPDDIVRAARARGRSTQGPRVPARLADAGEDGDVSPARRARRSQREIYKAADFQAFNAGRTVGKLRIVPIGTPYESLVFGRHEIVLLQESYPDITPVAGIIATTFSTPLSHVNLRANAWGIPNAGDKQALSKIGRLDGKTVYLEVTDTKITLREGPAEIKGTGRIVAPGRDCRRRRSNPRLAMLTRMRAKDATIYGTKSANLGEIVTANLEGVRVPAGFGVPFFYYVQQCRSTGPGKVAAMLDDKRFKTDAAWRKTALEELRADQQALIDQATSARSGACGSSSRARACSCAARPTPRTSPASTARGSTTPWPTSSARRRSARRCEWCGPRCGRCAPSTSARRSGSITGRCSARCSCRSAVNATAAGVLITKNHDPSDAPRSRSTRSSASMRASRARRSRADRVRPGPTTARRSSRADDPVMPKFDDKAESSRSRCRPAQVILTEARARRRSRRRSARFMSVFTHGKPLDANGSSKARCSGPQARPFVGASICGAARKSARVAACVSRPDVACRVRFAASEARASGAAAPGSHGVCWRCLPAVPPRVRSLTEDECTTVAVHLADQLTATATG
jgi:hypothetical protein